MNSEGQLEKAHEEEEEVVSEEIQYPFYTEGPIELLDARIDTANYSLVKAAERLQRELDYENHMDEAEILNQAGNLVLDRSEIGDDRPLSACSFSYDGNFLATCSFTGLAKLWSMPLPNNNKHSIVNHSIVNHSILKAHTERATDVTFSPVSNHILATASADRTAKLWNADNGLLLQTFQGHLDRLARIAFHPSGEYLATTSFDKTWRLWDIHTGAGLLLQEDGHSKSVYGIDFHKDGSLAASCGLDSLARVWDLRTGTSLLALQGHVKPVLGVNFSPNGYHLATCGEDNTCRVWDLRNNNECLYIIPAHSNVISQVKFEPEEGSYLVTASFDMTAKVWSARDFMPLKTLRGHEARVTGLDIRSEDGCIATVSHDRMINLWRTAGQIDDLALDFMDPGF
ncbi:hypothetical protein CCACVL1_28403 [Corchorus capsularis]|uniref:Uncharacterized protein n=1 Tax=Corchorus capsularis TaxID=210143 RepID=A0A1R3G6K6_COCAP|nr:hypothetical protein CCACVL1_28403 [Corchorus capsularis]